MTFRGTIKNGVVIFDEPVTLGEGTVVEVAPVKKSGRPMPGTPEAMRLLQDLDWAGDVQELRRLQTEVQAMREADLTPPDELSRLDRA